MKAVRKEEHGQITQQIDGTYKPHQNTTTATYIVQDKKTNSKRISDTVFFKHKYITQPTITPADIIKKAINDLAAALKGWKNIDGIMEMEALQKLVKLLNKTQNLPTPTIDSHSNAATPTATTQHNMPQPRVKTTVPTPTPMETS